MTADTTEINGLLAALPPEGGIVTLDAGRVYDIDPSLTATGGVRLTGVNKTLRLNGATLRAVPNSLDGYAIVRMGIGAMDPADARIHKHLRIKGPGVIEGDRFTHTGTTGEQGMGVWITNCEDAFIDDDVEIRNCWGDGVYFDKNDITQGSISLPQTRPIKAGMRRCWVHHNRRNNLSLVGAGYVDIFDNIIEMADGTGPYAGIDIEPDTAGIGVENVRIKRNTLRGNKGPGVEIVNVAGDIVKDVEISGNTITANGIINGFGIKVVDMHAGWLSIFDNTISLNYGDGIYIERLNPNYPLENVLIDQNRIRENWAATIAYQGGTSCGWGVRFKNMSQNDVQLGSMNRIVGNGYGDIVWQ